MRLYIMVLLVINCYVTSAQNNAIFQGGSGDGTDKLSFSQAFNNIYSGGNSDGWNSTSFTQATVNIFLGGNSDGWNNSSYLQPGSDIFNGGSGDGWTFTNYLQTGNGIFNGGVGDGWHNTTFLQPGNNIFTGGIGDGWSSTYRPVGPLPVAFLNFNAQKQGEKVALLKWKTAQELNSAYFDIERSTDAVNFIYIGRVNASGNSQAPVEYFFSDNQPLDGINYYRLKQVDRDALFIYTPARAVRFNALQSELVKFYPNPTSGILNIELSNAMRLDSKTVNITNAAGLMLDQFRIGNINTSLLSIDLKNYPKGIYFIQVVTKSVNNTQRVVLQ